VGFGNLGSRATRFGRPRVSNCDRDMCHGLSVQSPHRSLVKQLLRSSFVSIIRFCTDAVVAYLQVSRSPSKNAEPAQDRTRSGVRGNARFYSTILRMLGENAHRNHAIQFMDTLDMRGEDPHLGAEGKARLYPRSKIGRQGLWRRSLYIYVRAVARPL
jgi:hypothetical protein